MYNIKSLNSKSHLSPLSYFLTFCLSGSMRFWMQIIAILLAYLAEL